MKRLLSAVAALTLLVPALPAEAGYSRGGGVRQRECYKEIYREEYIPGTRDRPGRVRRWTETKRVPCNPRNRNPRDRPSNPRQGYDNNSCIEGSILGGIAGGAAGAALSRNEGNFIGIPLGIVGGALVGCQLDGG